MTPDAPTCGYCGYSRSVQVAGCDHATLPTAGVCQLPPGHAGDHDPAAQVDPAEGRCALPAAGEEMANAFRAVERPTREEVIHAAVEVVKEESGKTLLRHCLALEERASQDRAALAAEREKSALLAAELVDLQRQVVGRDEALVVLGTELEQERRECGRLRADLESARQLLDGAERGAES